MQARDIIKRLGLAIGAPALVDLARFLDISPPAINAAIRKRQVPDLWIYKTAVLTGHRVEWLRDGTEPRHYVEVLKDAAAVTDHLWTLQGEIERLATSPEQRLRLVHTVQDAASIIRAVSVSEAAAQYQVHGENQAELSALDSEGKATVHRLIQALLHGDQQIKTHLIGQLKIIEDAVVARKKKDQPTSHEE
ncbi:MAG TPA: hypothetical protein PKN47_01820 [Nitrospira sp.]|nr:hypothetical protein [Nitrospira sp.]